MTACISAGAQQKPIASTPSKLSYETLVTDGLPRASGAKLPTGEGIVSSPITSVLIFGSTDALLVDPPFSIEQTRQVIDWISRSGKHLKYIYSTHGHGDHWFGTKQILDRFPEAIPYAMPDSIAMMRQQATEGRQKIFDKDFPGQIGDTPVLARPMPAGGLDLEGNSILAIDIGHTDTDATTVLYVPSMQLVAAGDSVYNGAHQYLLEGGKGGLDAWLLALDKIEALKPSIVIAGHKNKALPDDPRTIGETRQYILDAKRLLSAKLTPLDYYKQMLALHPTRINPGPLWYSGVGLLSGVSLIGGQDANKSASVSK
ncbi:MBL fold metallo-hydrolase [Cupriavidus lacunae]|uniref:MBL fold metallo-hydrolase n=2 Tax=Cupriavidus lacunae TaxID=2666307 RepID=A0A370P281_9BURK|nr:MBL fold metallo-hydrolase [Cupriavidus lacunae]